jgi:hypothetical protein
MSNSISSSGLVFAIDSANTQKSFKGGPVTNIKNDVDAPWGYTNAEILDVTGTAEAGPVPTLKTWRFTHTGVNPQGSQWTGWETSGTGAPFTGSANDVWTCSYWYKSTQLGDVGVVFGQGAFYLPDWSRAYNYTILSNVNTVIADGKWHFNSVTTRINEAYANAIIADGPSWNTVGAGVLYLNGPQWNKNAYPSQLVSGTRANTGVFYDLAGLNTSITASSLTYDYTGAPSFNGTSDYLDLGTTLASSLQTGAITVMTVAKISSIVSKNCLLSLNGGQNFFLPGNRLTTTNQLYWDGAWVGGNSTSWNTNQYYHLAWVISGTTLTFYVNGVADGSFTVPAFAPATGVNARVGLANASEYGTGTIGLLTVHNRALSANEVKQSFIGVRSRFGI